VLLVTDPRKSNFTSSVAELVMHWQPLVPRTGVSFRYAGAKARKWSHRVRRRMFPRHEISWGPTHFSLPPSVPHHALSSRAEENLRGWVPVPFRGRRARDWPDGLIIGQISYQSLSSDLINL
jgi:hypothetical protein